MGADAMGSSRRFVRVVGFVTFAATCVSAVPAAATPIFYSRAFARATAGLFDTGITQDTGQVLGSDDAGPLNVMRTDPSSGATSSAFASVVDGTLHASA